MAKLITTDEEKAAVSFLDWDDAALGAMCKKMALTMHHVRGKANKDDVDAVINAADGILLIAGMVECNAGKLTLKFGDFTHKGKAEGDWEIKIKRTD